MHRSNLRVVLLWAAVLVVCVPLSATTVLQMNLAEMVGRADQIFRGTVLDVREGTVQAGGGELPIVTYRLRVDEALKGTFQEVKGLQIAEIKMVGKLKRSDSAPLRAFSPLPEVPQLAVGQSYLLLVTPHSSIGLSSPVGLGQGTFRLQGKPGQGLAVNLNQNLGLFAGMAPSGFAKTAAPPVEGPLPYAELAQIIRDIVEP